MKKFYLVLLLVCVVLFTACGGDSHAGLNKEEKKALKNYSEWADALELTTREDFPIASFSDEDGIYAEFEEDYSVNTADFARLSLEHNAFVSENENYFGDKKIEFELRTGGRTQYGFSNYLNIPSYEESSNDINIEQTDYLNVAKIDAVNDSDEKKVIGFANSVVETLVIYYYDSDLEALDQYDISYIGKYESLKNIVFFIYCFDEKTTLSDYADLIERIETEYPNVKAYVCLD